MTQVKRANHVITAEAQAAKGLYWDRYAEQWTGMFVIAYRWMGTDAIAMIPCVYGEHQGHNAAREAACIKAKAYSSRNPGDGVWVWDDTTGRDVGCYLDGKAI